MLYNVVFTLYTFVVVVCFYSTQQFKAGIRKFLLSSLRSSVVIQWWIRRLKKGRLCPLSKG